jgi:Protein of unknown function (DUF3455)
MKLFSKGLLNVAVRTTICLTTNATAQMPPAIAGSTGTPIATLHAEGAQVYECKPDSGKSQSEVSALTWQFREPIATLMVDGKSVGRHYAGPNWEHIDGSVVKGKVIASAPGATSNDIPWLELEVVDHHNKGTLADAVTVLRINTKGGLAQGSCESEGKYLSIPYAADYLFLRKSD